MFLSKRNIPISFSGNIHSTCPTIRHSFIRFAKKGRSEKCWQISDDKIRVIFLFQVTLGYNSVFRDNRGTDRLMDDVVGWSGCLHCEIVI